MRLLSKVYSIDTRLIIFKYFSSFQCLIFFSELLTIYIKQKFEGNLFYFNYADTTDYAMCT